MVGEGGLNWNCTSGSTICTCSGGKDSDDCSDLNSRMCGGLSDDLTCNTVGTCSCTRVKKGDPKKSKLRPLLVAPTKMAPTKHTPAIKKYKNTRAIQPTVTK